MYSIVFLVTSVNFSQSAYMVDENDGMVQFILLLSNPSSTNITVEVSSIDGSATGEYLAIVHNIIAIVCGNNYVYIPMHG